VIEDAAQGVGATYKGRPLGSIGHLGAYSFHDSKVISSGEGGALLVGAKRFAERAEILWEKGTNRSQLIRGQVKKYTWVDVGSSFLMSDLSAAFLETQLKDSAHLIRERLKRWNIYHKAFKVLEEAGFYVAPPCRRNANITATSIIFFLRSKK
jgi:dTDP-4-amino-4,6-dideoxygalactose transaminase